jgi:polysaccharide pyruvyl transferase WcaK-like protein
MKDSDMAKKRIGLVGYFGYGNYGDELFLDVYRKYFYDCELVAIQDSITHPIYTQAAYDNIKTLDAIIIGGGDLFIPKYFANSYFDEQFLQKPIYLHGVGVPLWTGEDPKVIERMAKFVQHPNVRKINVRDVESAEWVHNKLKPKAPIDFSADMVFSLDFPRIERDSRKKIFGLIMRHLSPGTTRWDHIAALCDRARSLNYTVHNIVLGTGKIRDDDLVTLKEFDYPQMEIVDPNDLGRVTKAIGACDVVASTKFHGCVVATAYGIPTITLTTTDKFLSLYKVMERRDLIGHHIHPDIAERLPKYIAPIPSTTRDMLRDDAVIAMQELRRQILDEIS